MKLRTLKNNINIRGKRVLLRIDANVPIKRGKAIDGPNGKIARAAVDVEWFSQRGARVILISHLGRPNGKRVAAYSLRPIAKRMGELLRMKVPLIHAVSGSRADQAVSHMKDGEVIMLENLRFDAREEKNSTSLACELASLGDMYVNDAFAVSHRAHASLDAITSELPSYAGPSLVHEVQVLEKVMDSPKRPFLLFVGGLKIHTKLPLMLQLLPKVDKILLGGALANTFFCAVKKDCKLGKTVMDKTELDTAHKLLSRWKKKIVLPCDVIVARGCRRDARMRQSDLNGISEKEMIVDVGKESLKLYAKEIADAKTIIWNGPFGFYECEQFGEGSRKLAKLISSRTGKALTVVGGGDTEVVAEEAKVANQFSLLSSGGGAMLAFLAEEEMPAIEALRI